MGLPHFIVLSGVCACGKSSVGRKLAERLTYEFVDGDDYHSLENIKKMSDGVGLDDNDRRLWLDKLSHFGDKSKKRIVLACSALKCSYRLVLNGSNTAAECRIFLLNVEREILEQRLQSRKNHYAKLSLLDSQLQTLELPVADETNVSVINVGGDESMDEIVERILIQLEAHGSR